MTVVEIDRRRMLAGIGVAAGSAAVAPLLTGVASAATGSAAGADPDALLRAGRFALAARGYDAILRKDPDNAHAARQRGYVALVCSRFAEAEKYLTAAARLAPADKQAKQWLAYCYLRQDRYPSAAPLLRAVGRAAEATWYEAIGGRPYQISIGPSGRVPWLSMDPLPTFEGSVNGLPPRSFGWDTGDTLGVGLTTRMAEEAGLRAVAQTTFNGGGQTGLTLYFGVLSSFRMGDVELRNIPVSWSDLDGPHEIGTDAGAGGLGIEVFSHLITTFDWARAAMTFRERTPEQARAVRAAAARAGCPPLPLWSDDHGVPYTLGSVNGSGQRVVQVNTGMADGVSVRMASATAERLGVRVDQSRAMYGATHGQIFKEYPCYPDRVAIGPASARRIYCATAATVQSAPAQFDELAAFGHTFFKPYALTLDYAGMNLYVTGSPGER